MLSCYMISNLTHTASLTWSAIYLLPSLLGCLCLLCLAIALAIDLWYVALTAHGTNFATLKNQWTRLSSRFTRTQKALIPSERNDGRTTLAPLSTIAFVFVCWIIYLFVRVKEQQ